MVKTQEALAALKKTDSSLDKALESLLTDLYLQEALNGFRAKNGQTQIDFMSVKTVEDIKDPKYNITHDDLINSMAILEQDELMGKFNNSFDYGRDK